ncbi:hypothetical protein AB4Y45_33895 [Paraburkholderia sp. EG287A]|uniref:hypothetical protein n=1 Tax=Paraburkholderia sp. EG287A TaxID=3237012 RepID=UPI0034D26D61
MIEIPGTVVPLAVDDEPRAVASNMCPHCHSPVGAAHKEACPDGPGRVGYPQEPVYTAQLA